jgi:arginase
MLLDAGTVLPEDTALVGARNLDPPEEEFIAASGLRVGEDGVEEALADVSCVYVALDCDVFDPGEVASFMPEPDGLSIDTVERLFHRIADQAAVVGVGLTGLAPDPLAIGPLERLCTALGL